MTNSILAENLYGVSIRKDERKADPGERKTYEIKSLWQRNHEIVNLASLGYKHTEIAEILNIHPQTVSNTMNSELGKAKTNEIRNGRDEDVKKIHERIRILTNKALDTYMEIFDDDSGECNLKDKKSVADTVISDLSGLKVPTKIQSASVHTVLTSEELQQVKNRGLKAIENSGMIIEAEIEPDTETT